MEANLYHDDVNTNQSIKLYYIMLCHVVKFNEKLENIPNVVISYKVIRGTYTVFKLNIMKFSTCKKKQFSF